MPEVIADTSPIQYLYQTDCLHLLHELYGTVRVPEGVAEEIAEGRALGYSVPDLDQLSWVRIVSVPRRRILLLAGDLGKGEREVLYLATERTDTLALLDDGLARRMAAHLGRFHRDVGCAPSRQGGGTARSSETCRGTPAGARIPPRHADSDRRPGTRRRRTVI